MLSKEIMSLTSEYADEAEAAGEYETAAGEASEEMADEMQQELSWVEQGLELAAEEAGLDEATLDEAEAQLEAAIAGEASNEELSELADAITAVQNGELGEEAADQYSEHVFAALIPAAVKLAASPIGQSVISGIGSMIGGLFGRRRARRRPMPRTQITRNIPIRRQRTTGFPRGPPPRVGGLRTPIRRKPVATTMRPPIPLGQRPRITNPIRQQSISPVKTLIGKFDMHRTGTNYILTRRQ
jgi:hypothetical protein